jgi:hypothetical protein
MLSFFQYLQTYPYYNIGFFQENGGNVKTA